MRPFLIFAPYVLIPLMLTLIWKRLNFKRTDWTYPFTVLLIFFYPYVVFRIDDLINPPLPGPRCLMPEMGFFIRNLFILLPVSLALQFVFNKIFLTNKNKPTTTSNEQIEK